jgi:hypothetical protein
VTRALVAGVLLLTLAACNAGPAPTRTRELPPAPPPPTIADDLGACAADVRQCPDGSFVARDPARRCAFAPCPGDNRPDPKK